MKFLYNIRFFRVLRDVKNYFYLHWKIRKLSKTREWKGLNLRYGWFAQTGTVLNMRKEDFGENEDILMLRVMEKAKPVFNYFTDNNLGEIIKPSLKRIEDTYSYKVILWPLFYDLTLGYIISRLIFIWLSVKIFIYLDKYFFISDWIMNLINHFKNVIYNNIV